MSNSQSHPPQVSDESTLRDRETRVNPTNPGANHWLACFQHRSKLLIAWVEPGNFTVYSANDAFCHLTGITAPTGNLQDKGIRLFDLFTNVDASTLEQLYRHHLPENRV